MLRLFIIISVLLSAVCLAKVHPRGLENAMDISSSGIIAQRTKAEVLAENIANIDTIKTETGLPYRKKTVIMRPAENFARKGSLDQAVLSGVVVAEIEEKMVTENYQRVYQPDHPEADSEGFVYYPKVDLTKELVELSQTSGAFENNVVVFNTTKEMMKNSLEIGQ
jgi:flagellar basal-body rod protein FlgC